MKAFGVLLAILCFAANAQADAGLVTQVQGKVMVADAAGKLIPAEPFVKLVTGTQITVEANGKFQVVYLESGRQETWSGGSQLEIGTKESKPVKAEKLPAVKVLPPMILKGLTQAPTMVTDMRSRQGMIRVRAMTDWAKIEEAEKNYKSLRSQSAEDDVTPELYLLSMLSEVKAYSKMKTPLEAMRTRQPSNSEIQALYDAYAQQMENGKGSK